MPYSAFQFGADAVTITADTTSQAIPIPINEAGQKARSCKIATNGDLWFAMAFDVGGTPTMHSGATAVTAGAGGNGILLNELQNLEVSSREYDYILVRMVAGTAEFNIAPIED